MTDTNDRITNERRRSHRWSASERRRGGDRRDKAHKAFARQLPDKYMSMFGSPRERVLSLVKQYCRGCDELLQADLAQAVLPTLQTIETLDGGVVTEEHKLECETAVEKCVRQNELATGRWETACVEEVKP